MASYYMLRPLYNTQLVYPSPSAEDRIGCLGRRGSIAVSTMAVAFGNYPGRVDTAVDSGTKVSDPQFFPNILDAQFRSKDSTSPPSLPPDSNGSDGPGPSGLDFEIYASNTMDGFEPPPPPRIPFGGPFEDYYGETVGEDYIPKQEKPTSSLLMFLDSLNAKKAEEDAKAAKNPQRPLFSQSRPVPSARVSDNRSLFPQYKPVEQTATTAQPAAEATPLFPQTGPVEEVSGDIGSSSSLSSQRSNVQEIRDASSRPLISQNRTVNVSPSCLQNRTSEVSALSPQTRNVEEPKVQKPSFSPISTTEQALDSGRHLFSQTGIVEPLSPTTRTARDRSMPSSPQIRSAEPPRDNNMPYLAQTRSLQEIKDSSRPISIQPMAIEEVRDSSRSLSPQTRTTEETIGSRPLSPSTSSFEEASRSLFPQTRSAEEIRDSTRSFSLRTRLAEEVRESNRRFIPETIDSNGTLFPQSRPVEEIRGSRRPFEDSRDSRNLVAQNLPLEETGDVRLIPQSRHVEDTMLLAPQMKPMEETRDSSQPISTQVRPSEGTSGNSRLLPPQTRPVEATNDSGRSSSQTRPVEEIRDSVMPPFPQSRPVEVNRDTAQPLSPQTRPVEGTSDDKPLFPGIAERSTIQTSTDGFNAEKNAFGQSDLPGSAFTKNFVDVKHLDWKFAGTNEQALGAGSMQNLLKRSMPAEAPTKSQTLQNAWTGETSESRIDQVDGVMAAEPRLSGSVGSPTLTTPALVMNSPNDFAEVVPKSQFYEPREGDIVLGVVISANDQKVDLEIGAELSALISFRDFQPFPQIVDNTFFTLPPTNGSQTFEGFVAPHGRSLLVEDRAANDGSYHDEFVDIGTVVIAEVQARTLIDGRAILSCRLPARRLAWHRIKQVMGLGEAIQLEIVHWNEGGLLGYLEGVRAFLPRSELLQRPERTAVLNDYVGRTLTVSIVQADEQASNIIISELKPWMGKNLQLGTVHDVTVTRVYPYGMQVEVNNTRIRGFVHISNFSKEFVRSVADIFAEGDKARVMLIKGRNPQQVSFSIADLESDRGLIFRDKEQVFQEAEEMARIFREGLSDQERQIFGVASESSLDFQDIGISNLNWLHFRNAS